VAPSRALPDSPTADAGGGNRKASCYQTSLELAVKNNLSAIVFAAVSTGIYGYPSYHAARVALDTVRRFMETDDGAKLELVVFCNFEKKDEAAYSELTS
jgi:O-acetyl-ADP-ribose deacetylase (regulator of RNase III)